MILIYTENTTSRLKYIFNLIFCDLLNAEIRFTNSKDEFLAAGTPKFNYSGSKIKDELFLESNPILFEESIVGKNILVSEFQDQKIFFETNEDSFFCFDIFAASFYLISRYEEYLPGKKDKFGRFLAENCIAFKNNFLEEPIVNNWVLLFRKKLKEVFPKISFAENNFSYIPTIDIDNAFAYKFKGYYRIFGALAKTIIDFNFKETIERIKVLLDLKKDPYDTYSFLNKVHKQHKFNAIFFFLLGNFSQYDRNIPVSNVSFRKMIYEISRKISIGIHPSFASNTNKAQLKKEIHNLKEIANQKIEISRQHYLMLFFPETYQNLLENGIKQDYTLGYAEKIGFRAGICSPFNFFDLTKNIETDLKIFPFQVMDVSLKKYLKFSSEESIQKITELIEKVKRVNGTFISLWHNESLNDIGEWNGWRKVYTKMLEACQ
ncbi:MAG: hypothetical protein HN704_07600 [Bacteroidetes bacterium]|jgi:hypothetical protein|nr:hypothetical protein [Bacteroidota bacterium]MBT6685308.1 hypothetical protein [Bacteroidota bacterium]MBT7143431.1 hypothetical protein [Bacteroidota bacterium]MBT7491453.1 hypothetical protein [Bacteroidota bacterium]